jgi:hypothetical protein
MKFWVTARVLLRNMSEPQISSGRLGSASMCFSFLRPPPGWSYLKQHSLLLEKTEPWLPPPGYKSRCETLFVIIHYIFKDSVAFVPNQGGCVSTTRLCLQITKESEAGLDDLFKL